MARSTTPIVLIGGLWLDASCWDGVINELATAGRSAAAVALPGQGDDNTAATLNDQLDAVLAAVDTAGTVSGSKVLVVGHSAACALAWLAADRRPELVAGVALIGGWPSPDGEKYADFFEPVDGLMGFPGWEAFEGPDSADISVELKLSMAAAAHPVPVGVSRGVVQLADERRYGVPVTLICPEFSPDQAREWLAAGDLPELAAATTVTYIDIDSGHWPMFTRPTELAAIIDAIG